MCDREVVSQQCVGEECDGKGVERGHRVDGAPADREGVPTP